MPPQRATTVAERLRLMSGELTAAERKLMAALFANYPMAGLGSITDFAREADVSTPSVLRLAKKLGFLGTWETIIRLGRAGFIEVIQVAPRVTLINIDSWYNHLRRCAEDPDFWELSRDAIKEYRKCIF